MLRKIKNLIPTNPWQLGNSICRGRLRDANRKLQNSYLMDLVVWPFCWQNYDLNLELCDQRISKHYQAWQSIHTYKMNLQNPGLIFNKRSWSSQVFEVVYVQKVDFKIIKNFDLYQELSYQRINTQDHNSAFSHPVLHTHFTWHKKKYWGSIPRANQRVK